MPRMTRVRALLSSVCLLSIACAGMSAPRRYVEVESPNFKIFSSMDVEATVELVDELEQFRALIFTITNAPQHESPVPTHIFAFARQHELSEFRQGRRSVGYFHHGLRANHVVLADYRRMGADAIIRHEYVHFILRNSTMVQYPLWYDEGFAELLSTAQRRDEVIAIGAFPKARANSFQYGRWIAFDRIVSARDYGDFRRQELHMFYAEAWALVHYLLLDRDTGRSAQGDIQRYLSLFESGTPDPEAFTEAFGESPQAVARKVIEILKGRKLRVIGFPTDQLTYERTEPKVREVTAAEVELRLGQLALQSGNTASAAKRFALALAQRPNDARAHAGIGGVYVLNGQWEEAEAHYLHAVDLGPSDALNHLDLAEYYHLYALKDGMELERDALLRDARRAYVRSQKLGASIPETYLMYGRSFLAPGQDAASGLDTLEHAYSLMPAHKEIIDALAEAYVATDQVAEARTLLNRRIAWSEKSDDLSTSVDDRVEAIRARRAQEAGK